MRAGLKVRAIFFVFLCAVLALGLFADRLVPYSYAKQFREAPNAPPCLASPQNGESLK